MRNRSTRAIGAVLLAFLATGTGVANAAEAQIAPTTDASSFGLLGPVGLAAVVLGIVGMALGVVRQRRKAAQAPAEPAAQVSEDATRPTLTPSRRPTV
ncbi:hypothetical protein LWP59_03755 [Amycolatopsis acidiphila]|uniref:hypothetical protein n=1 Tax=Amycolatopsis acidiphila TaxID=715473 RepID=UPI0019AE1DE2|nr:hypothetical protein [Amycolatopsis acidiphila]UIJ60806.1 hypothetical protein LWP59_03755 [Amycolatopsis acidiphila]GHG94026.1 hypothetical protein GCM10017788_71720 [Amycolatopsis acidiphila]